MSCLPCFQNEEATNTNEEEKNDDIPIAQPKEFPPTTPPGDDDNGENDPLDQDSRNAAETEDNTVKSFTFRELATATKNFRGECLVGEGGYGKVFKGTLSGNGQTVAVRQLDRNAGGKDFVFEVSTLSLLHHPNLVKMVGYCADGEQRLLVYEYLPSGSLESHLFDLPAGQAPLDWTSRMKIALGVAEGLEYLHEKADATMIYRDLKSSNVLLNEAKHPKLSDCGLAKLVQAGQKMHVSVMAGFNGYCAPEYERTGELTMKADVYSFGVVLLQLITGRRALDTSRPSDEQSLVSWAQPLFRDPSKYPDMADPLLRKGFPVTSLNQAVGVVAMCLQEEPQARPFISDISAALSFLAMAPPEAPIPERIATMLSRVPTARQGGGGIGDNNSGLIKDDSSESEAEEEEREEEEEEEEMDPAKQENDDGSGSDFEFGSSEGSDNEEMSRVPSQKESKPYKGQCKSTKSKKLGSGSKRKSKKKSVSGSTNGRGGKSGKHKIRQSQDSDRSSGSDGENCNNNGGSSP